MKVSSYLAISGVVAILFGLGFLLAPQAALPVYGVPAEPHNLMQTRYFGGAMVWVGLVAWLARKVRDGEALRALLQAGVVGNAVGALISIWAALSGLQNAMAWSSVLIYTLFLLGALYFLASPARIASAAHAS
ncbi:MAG TPA: hypothetical protein VK052_10440 [Zeimonas sp.]|nr:hypothetical protein [Zeimonas sp.]